MKFSFPFSPSSCQISSNDFGISKDTNRAVLEGYQHGLLKSVSLMANGEAFENAVNDRLRGNKAPSSGVAANNNASWEQLVKNADKMSAQEVAEAYQKLKL